MNGPQVTQKVLLVRFPRMSRPTDNSRVQHYVEQDYRWRQRLLKGYR